MPLEDAGDAWGGALVGARDDAGEMPGERRGPGGAGGGPERGQRGAGGDAGRGARCRWRAQ